MCNTYSYVYTCVLGYITTYIHMCVLDYITTYTCVLGYITTYTRRYIAQHTSRQAEQANPCSRFGYSHTCHSSRQASFDG